MSRVFITGSTDGLGLLAARALIADGHMVVLHARSPQRAAAVADVAAQAAGVVTGDLSSAAETRSVAEQVNRLGRLDAVIHNAGVYQLYVTALACAVARHWPDVYSNAVGPGWVPTKMGGAGASDDLTQGYLTQTWLAAGRQSEASASGQYWYHGKPAQAHAAAGDAAFQDRLMATLAELTGIELFS